MKQMKVFIYTMMAVWLTFFWSHSCLAERSHGLQFNNEAEEGFRSTLELISRRTRQALLKMRAISDHDRQGSLKADYVRLLDLLDDIRPLLKHYKNNFKHLAQLETMPFTVTVEGRAMSKDEYLTSICFYLDISQSLVAEAKHKLNDFESKYGYARVARLENFRDKQRKITRLVNHLEGIRQSHCPMSSSGKVGDKYKGCYLKKHSECVDKCERWNSRRKCQNDLCSAASKAMIYALDCMSLDYKNCSVLNGECQVLLNMNFKEAKRMHRLAKYEFNNWKLVEADGILDKNNYQNKTCRKLDEAMFYADKAKFYADKIESVTGTPLKYRVKVKIKMLIKYLNLMITHSHC